MIEKGKHNNYTHKKTNDDYIKSKNKSLIEKFIKNTTKSNTEKGNVESHDRTTNIIKEGIEDNDKEIRFKEEISKLKEQIRIEKEKRQNINNKLLKGDKKYNKIVLELQEANKRILELNNTIEKLSKENNKLLKDASFHKFEMQSLEKRCAITDNYLKNNDSTMQSLMDKNKRNRELIIELSKKDIVEKKDEEILELSNEIDSLQNTIKHLNRQINILKFDRNINNQRLSVQLKIVESAKKELYEKLNDTKDHIILGFVKDRVRKVKYFITYKFKSIKSKIKTKRNRYFAKERHVYGTLNKRFWSYKFVDLNGRVFKSVDNRTLRNKPFFQGINCVVNITNENIVKVLKTYPLEEIMFDDLKKSKQGNTKKNIKSSIKSNEKNKYNIELNILIITAMAGSNYKNNFRELGLNADIFNSYDENAKRLNSILSKYDIVFCCIRHAKHYCGDVIKNQKDYSRNSLKYNFIDNDGISNMLFLIDKYLEKINYENGIEEMISIDEDSNSNVN